ncbi:alpha/beta fold hydrolase [Kocuria sediminis]|uniref:Alpha/beta fold hydrolase n=1 Tax=Kocuria sediminis TaxID=1038857 RepID=A0A6N8GKC6_9MICC|nr:alpha/beta hydrolase [Kocuria sediminis]MUN62710.1 alpha/beta fold hydrolase [Kocuria sediminis]
MSAPPDPWAPDVLGPGFRARTVELGPGSAPHSTATVVRQRPEGRPAAGGAPRDAVLYLHGWSDYFFNAELARTCAAAGYGFYALDLHGYGRNLTDTVLAEGAGSPGHATDLADYDDDIAAALALMAEDGMPAPGGRLVLMGHSTGGLTAALWAAHHPGRLAGLALDAPWLGSHGSDAVGAALRPALGRLARRRPDRAVRARLRSHYYRVISEQAEGEWPIDPRWRPETSFDITPGWLNAVLRAQREVSRGLNLQVPVLVQVSARSHIRPWWSERMRSADTVLDVRQIRRHAPDLGRDVTVRSYEGAVHDVHLSREPVRRAAQQDLVAWLRALGRPAEAQAETPGPATRSTAPPYRRSRRA